MVQAVPKLRKIDADSELSVPADFLDLGTALPYPQCRGAPDGGARRVRVHQSECTSRGVSGYRRRGSAWVVSGAIGTRAPGGPVGHGVVADRAKLLPGYRLRHAGAHSRRYLRQSVWIAHRSRSRARDDARSVSGVQRRNVQGSEGVSRAVHLARR